MINQPAKNAPVVAYSRRMMLAVAIPAAVSCMPAIAADPTEKSASIADEPIAAQSAVQRVVTPIANRTVRLEPTSTEIARTVVSAIATDPRGEIVAVSGDDHAIRILNASTLELIKTLTEHTDNIRTLDFDPRGDRLVSAGNDGQLILWNRNQNFKIQQRMRGTPALARVSFSPDGNEMGAVGFGSDIYLISRDSRTQQPTLECNCNDLRALAYREDGEMLAVAGRNGELSLFDRPNGQPIGQFKLHSGRIYELAFAESSSLVISVGADGNICMFDTDSKQIVRRFNVTSGQLFSVTILDGQHIAVAGSDNMIRLVNISIGRVVEELKGHKGSIAALESDGDLLFSGGYDATLRRWQLSGIRQDRERIADRDRKLDR